MTDIVESATQDAEPTYSFRELFETAHNLGLLESWRIPSDVRNAYDEGEELPDNVAMGPGISDLLYRYIMQDDARARLQGFAFLGDGADAYGELVQLAGGVAGADSARIEAESMGQLVAHVNLVLAKGGAAKRVVVFAFTGDARLVGAYPADRTSELADLGLLAEA